MRGLNEQDGKARCPCVMDGPAWHNIDHEGKCWSELPELPMLLACWCFSCFTISTSADAGMCQGRNVPMIMTPHAQLCRNVKGMLLLASAKCTVQCICTYHMALHKHLGASHSQEVSCKIAREPHGPISFLQCTYGSVKC